MPALTYKGELRATLSPAQNHPNTGNIVEEKSFLSQVWFGLFLTSSSGFSSSF